MTVCLIIFAYDCHPSYRFILAANRDEYYRRPTEQARFWDSHPWVLAGRDLEMLGTWMGITRSGRFAALTNFRNPSAQILNPKSRGTLVSNFLCSQDFPDHYMLDVVNNRTIYNPFNLLVGDFTNLLYFNNQSSVVLTLRAGIFGLCNHLLDTPWPKVRKSKQILADYLVNTPVVKPEFLFEILADKDLAQDNDLPDTGINRELEKMLSPIFIEGIEYGTRSSTVLLIDRNNHVIFQEKSFLQGQEQGDIVKIDFDICS